MTVKGAHTPITDDEAAEWVKRMVGSTEELAQSFDASDWRAFLEDKLLWTQDQHLSEAQFNSLMIGRGGVYERMAEAGFVFQTFEIKGVETHRIYDLNIHRWVSWQDASKWL